MAEGHTSLFSKILMTAFEQPPISGEDVQSLISAIKKSEGLGLFVRHIDARMSMREVGVNYI